MLSNELREKIKQIEITTRKVVDDALTGRYRSSFKGQGVQFSEHRQYIPGDDVRHINWNVSARTREPLIKKFDEERELTVFLIVDVSKSQSFGSSLKLKSEIVAELGGILAYAATHTGDRLGVLLFSGKIEKIIPPKKGRMHILRVIQELLTHRSYSHGTDLAQALDGAGRIMKHSGIVFILSDFLAENYEYSLRRLARRHDLIAFQVSDERETKVPPLGNMLWVNPETEQECLVDASSYFFKRGLEELQTAFEMTTQTIFRSHGIETVKIQTHEDYVKSVIQFFKARSRLISKVR